MKAARPKRHAAQLSLLPPPPFDPIWPHAGTLAARCLDILMRGGSLTHPQFEAVSFSWRLAAVVYELRDLGWPIESQEISASTPECPDRQIAHYQLPTDICAQAKLLRSRHG